MKTDKPVASDPGAVTPDPKISGPMKCIQRDDKGTLVVYGFEGTSATGWNVTVQAINPNTELVPVCVVGDVVQLTIS